MLPPGASCAEALPLRGLELAGWTRPAGLHCRDLVHMHETPCRAGGPAVPWSLRPAAAGAQIVCDADCAVHALRTPLSGDGIAAIFATRAVAARHTAPGGAGPLKLPRHAHTSARPYGSGTRAMGEALPCRGAAHGARRTGLCRPQCRCSPHACRRRACRCCARRCAPLPGAAGAAAEVGCSAVRVATAWTSAAPWPCGGVAADADHAIVAHDARAAARPDASARHELPRRAVTAAAASAAAARARPTTMKFTLRAEAFADIATVATTPGLSGCASHARWAA